MLRLPKELIEIIGLKLSKFQEFEKTNKRIYRVLNTESFYRKRIRQEYPDFQGQNTKHNYLGLKFFNKKDINASMESFSRGGKTNMDLIFHCIFKGANNWNWGMDGAAWGGHRDLVDFFIKKGANRWNSGLWYATQRGCRNLIDFFISQGANNWNDGMLAAVRKGDRDLVEFFIKKGANSCWWDDGMTAAAKEGNRELVDLFISKGACCWNRAMHAAEGHKDLVNFFKSKI